MVRDNSIEKQYRYMERKYRQDSMDKKINIQKQKLTQRKCYRQGKQTIIQESINKCINTNVQTSMHSQVYIGQYVYRQMH